MKLFVANTLVFIALLLSLVSHKAWSKSVDIDFAIAQKLMLDLRYYCPTVNNKGCNKPLTELPEELKTMISDSGLGGVILFADNLSDPAQIKQLTGELKQAGLANKHNIPLFISVDQEGGRVVRLPMQHSTSFSGNMAIGATFEKHGTKFATQTGKVIGTELREFGFNVNHAPNVDVNVNPNNPVINVRSFSESAQVVSQLGNAQLEAMQAQGIIGTLKHFPGHGDTNVDSHTGLPRVNHGLDKIRSVDLQPFQYAIDRGNAEMIMTAHIQYPSLDASTLVNKEGLSMIKPATMSREILTNTLREKMGFKGVIITDALDMKGISSFFTETEAVIRTFQAGADIALMPIKIRNPEDIKALKSLIGSIKLAISQERLSEQEIINSYKRIAKLKKKITKTPTLTNKEINKDTHHKIENELAIASLTAIKGSGKLNSDKVHFIMPDPNKCLAITEALARQVKAINSTCTDYLSNSYQQTKAAAEKAQAIVVASITPEQSLAEIGGVDNIADNIALIKQAKWPKLERKKQLRWLMRSAILQNKQVIFVSLRAPYESYQFKALTTDIIATYSYTHSGQSKQLSGPVYSALAKLFSGDVLAQGTLPVTIN